MFINLYTHSCYSFLEGIPTPKELVEAAQFHGMNAIALTDHLSLTGAIEFYKACQEARVKPIIGLEIDLVNEAQMVVSNPVNQKIKLVLYAINLKGWRNLCRLSSHLLINDILCSINLLKNFSAELICMIPALESPPTQALMKELKSVFSDNLYLGISSLDSDLVRLAGQLNLPVVAVQPVYYLYSDQAPLQRTMTAIRLNTTVDQLAPGTAAPANTYFAIPTEMETRFSDLPEALRSIEEINKRCSLELPLGELHFPRIELPPDLSIQEYLREKVETGAKYLYGNITADIQSRLDHELNIIAERGYEPIFLIVEEILDYARKVSIPFSSRGSAASSLVAHCLGITSPDPLHHNLYFERFLNPARSTPPDIDTDLCSRRRDEIIQHVFVTYGVERVAMVGTINRFRPRSALGDVAKAHGLSPTEVSRLTKELPYHFFNRVETEESNGDTHLTFASLKQNNPAPHLQLIFSEASALLGLPRHLSVHAGGIVIAPGPMTDWVPVQRSGSKGITITQFDLDSIEQMGLVKIDLLGIRGLTVMSDVAQSILSWSRTEFSNPLEVLEAIPLSDEPTSQMVYDGQTIGCFQIESPGMRTTLRELHARSIEDIIRALALYRPGPIKGGLRDAFVRRHNGQEKVSHLHPALAPILDETYGVILYQEQVLKLAHELAGLSLADADLLRRAMSHFDPGDQLKTVRERFVKNAQQRSGVPIEVGEQAWEMMAAFAGYGFPKAHAASYAEVAWRSAWCKAHFPAEFIAAVLANWGGYYSQRVYFSEARRLGLSIYPPHINHSLPQFSVAYPQGQATLYMGLDQVRDLTRRTQDSIQRQRPFHTLHEFLLKVDPRPQEVKNLIRVGAFSGLGTIPELLHQLSNAQQYPGQLSLFTAPPGAGEEDWSLKMKIRAQTDLLGIPVEAHPLELYAGQIRTLNAINTVEAVGRKGQKVRVAGIRQTWHRTHTNRNEIMAFLTLEDPDGTLDVVVFPSLYRAARSSISGSDPLLIEGVVEVDEERGEPILIAERVWQIKESD